MAVGCTCLIYYQGVVSVEKGSVIIRHKLAELIKKLGGEHRSPAAAFRARLQWGIELCSPAAVFRT